MKSKILFLTSTFPSKDHPNKGIFNYRSVKSLADDYDIKIYKLRTWKPFKPLYKHSTYQEINLTEVYVPIPFGGTIGTVMYAYIAAFLFRHIKRENYSLIFTSGLTSAGLIGCLLSIRTNIPHIGQVIGSDVNFALEKQVKLGLSKTYYRGLNGVVSVSNALSQKLMKMLPALNNVQVIYRGINLQKFNLTPYHDHAGTSFLFLGGFPESTDSKIGINLKGGKDVVDVWSENEEWFKENNCRLSLGGPFSDEPKWTDWRAQLKHPELVTVLGRVNEQKVMELLTTHDIVLMPSLAEGLPNLAVEASAIGRFIIASDAGGIPEIIDNNRTGIIIPAGDKTALKEAMISYAPKKDLLEEFGKQARKKMEQHFDGQIFSLNIRALFSKVQQQN